MNPSPFATAAHAYAARGWSVIPFVAGATRPAIAWREFESRRASRDEIDAWNRHHPDANVGMVTGAVSKLVVLDVDPAHGGAASLADFQRENAALPVTVEAISGGGGRHLYFAHPGTSVPNQVGVAPGIDIRGDGGCIVAPPSLHPNGRRYTWLQGRAPGDVAIAAMPDWLLARVLRGRARPSGRSH